VATFGLPRNCRLLRPSEFAALRGNSDRVVTRSIIGEYRHNGKPVARLGIAVSRRVDKRAVVRNRIRRVIRESFRLHRAALPAADILVIARVQAAGTVNAQLRVDLDTLWRRLTTPTEERTLKTDGGPGTMRAGR
jgi:ribonuclease P protein component